MSNPISSLIFAYRNVGKTQNGEIGRAPVAAAQGINVLTEVTRYNKALAKGADATMSIFNNLANKSKVADYALKGVKWATNNVNPMICVSGGIKVAMSDNKTETALKEFAALSAMFAGEGMMKNVILPRINIGGKLGTIVKGIAFVGASIASYSIGEYLGKDLAAQTCASFSPAKINQMA